MVGGTIDRRSACGTLLLRLTVGSLFITHLYWKFGILDGGLMKWWGNFAVAGYPSIVPWYAISAEVVGAALITAGLFTRWACLYTIPFMVGAAHFWLVRKGFFFTAAGAELPVLWTLLLIVQALLGSGPASVDGWRAAREQCRGPAA